MAEDPATDRLKQIVESILFVADEPVELSVLGRVMELRTDAVARVVDAVAADCQTRGVRVQRTGTAVQMVTAPETMPHVEQFLGVEENRRISRAALETLAIIAYKQPITRSGIEAIRGVNCDQSLASLKVRALVAEVGRAPGPGRPYLYGTTFRFLEHFGLEKPEDLPPLGELSQPEGEAQVEE
jgi:segregation and condensation protein B